MSKTTEERMDELAQEMKNNHQLVQQMIEKIGSINSEKKNKEQWAESVMQKFKLSDDGNVEDAEQKAEVHMSPLQEYIIKSLIESFKKQVRMAKKYGNSNKMKRLYGQLKEDIIDCYDM